MVSLTEAVVSPNEASASASTTWSASFSVTVTQLARPVAAATVAAVSCLLQALAAAAAAASSSHDCGGCGGREASGDMVAATPLEETETNGAEVKLDQVS